MSDIHQDDKPWNLVSDRRAHRCIPKTKRRGKPRLGDRGSCECGVSFIFTESCSFGGQWLPVAAPSESAGHARGRKSRSTGERAW